MRCLDRRQQQGGRFAFTFAAIGDQQDFARTADPRRVELGQGQTHAVTRRALRIRGRRQ